jgi:glycosylphosphatidylinositol transamidase (GPIT) subunit GPI8
LILIEAAEEDWAWYVHMQNVHTHYRGLRRGGLVTEGKIYVPPASGAVVICVQHRCHVINFGHIFQERDEV